MSAAVVEVRAAAVDVSASITGMSAAVTDMSAATANVSTYFVGVSAVAVNMSADVNVADVNIVPIALNHGTSRYDNIVSTSRREFTGRSVEPSNVTGINNQHMMWIRQVMMDDLEIQFPHKF